MGRQLHLSQIQCWSPSQNHPLHSQRCLYGFHTLLPFSAVRSPTLTSCKSVSLLVFSSHLLLHLFLLAHPVEESCQLLNSACQVLSLMSSPLFHLLSHLCLMLYFVVCPELCPVTSSAVAFLIL